MLTLYQRAKIREKSRDGSSASDLAREFEVHVTTIYRVIREGERRKKRRGRPLKTSSRQRKEIINYFRQNPLNSAAAAARHFRNFISPSCVRRILRISNFRYKPVISSFTLKPETIASRLEFARTYVSKNQEYWDRVIFTDEKKFNLVGNDGIRISAWSASHQQYEISQIQPSRASLMVWGAISSSGTLQLICTSESITAQTYVNMLEEEFFSQLEYDLPEDLIWMHDNAPPHRANFTREYFEGKQMEVLKWPPHSPDLNPIENVWGMLQKKVYEGGKTFRNTTELWEELSIQWRQIPNQTIRNLYNSMRKRCCDVLQANGQRIKY